MGTANFPFITSIHYWIAGNEFGDAWGVAVESKSSLICHPNFDYYGIRITDSPERVKMSQLDMFSDYDSLIIPMYQIECKFQSWRRLRIIQLQLGGGGGGGGKSVK